MELSRKTEPIPEDDFIRPLLTFTVNGLDNCNSSLRLSDPPKSKARPVADGSFCRGKITSGWFCGSGWELPNSCEAAPLLSAAKLAKGDTHSKRAVNRLPRCLA